MLKQIIEAYRTYAIMTEEKKNKIEINLLTLDAHLKTRKQGNNRRINNIYLCGSQTWPS